MNVSGCDSPPELGADSAVCSKIRVSGSYVRPRMVQKLKSRGLAVIIVQHAAEPASRLYDSRLCRRHVT